METEEEARAFVEQVKKKHYDARHNCWCYRLRDGGVERYSDDGEPQGTAGQPMLNVFQREEVTNVVCVVTRYFGGVLLGAGGLVRAYTQSAKDALDAAGVSVVRRWVEAAVPCPYSFFDRVKLEVEAHGGVLGETEYAADVTVHALLPEGQVEAHRRRHGGADSGRGLQGGASGPITGHTGACPAALRQDRPRILSGRSALGGRKIFLFF